MKTAVLIAMLALAARAAGAEPPVVSWDQAATVAGRQCVVEGAVVQTARTPEACTLQFAADNPTAFAAVIYAINFPHWARDVEAYYRGATVRVKGVVLDRGGRPQICVSEPSQIQVIKRGATPPAKPAATAAVTPPPPPAPEPAAPPVVAATPVSPGLLPFEIDVKRFSGARHPLGIVSALGASYEQRVHIELTLRNMSNQSIGDIDWQWVAVAVNSAGGAQYYHGAESDVELRPFETLARRSQELRLITRASRSGDSGSKMRGHYVRLSYRGQCVFAEASPPDLKEEAEDYLENLKRGVAQARPARSKARKDAEDADPFGLQIPPGLRPPGPREPGAPGFEFDRR